MDIIICSSTRDCLILRKSIYFLYQNIENARIYILTARSNFRLFPKRFLRKYNVHPIDELEIVPDRDHLEIAASAHFSCKYRFGWYYQQFLKMGFALSRYADKEYLIWDADTILLNKINFFDRGKMIFTPKSEYHKAYFVTINRLLGYDKEVQYSYIAEHMPVSVPIMQELIAKISNSDIPGSSWTEKILAATPEDDPNGFSEFETYGTYCYHNYSGCISLRELRTYREGGRHYSRLVPRHILKKLSGKYDTVSIETWSRPDNIRIKICNRIEMWIIRISGLFLK